MRKIKRALFDAEMADTEEWLALLKAAKEEIPDVVTDKDNTSKSGDDKSKYKGRHRA